MTSLVQTQTGEKELEVPFRQFEGVKFQDFASENAHWTEKGADGWAGLTSPQNGVRSGEQETQT